MLSCGYRRTASAFASASVQIFTGVAFGTGRDEVVCSCLRTTLLDGAASLKKRYPIRVGIKINTNPEAKRFRNRSTKPHGKARKGRNTAKRK